MILIISFISSFKIHKVNPAALDVVVAICWVGGLPKVLDVFDISDITQYPDHDKSQLIKDKSKDLQKLFKYFNGTTTFASNVLTLFGVLPINFVLHAKDLIVVLLSFILKLFASLFSLAESFTASL